MDRNERNRVGDPRETVYAFAKVNLTLHVIRKREDGYHDLDLIFQPVSRSDRLYISDNDSGRLVFTCSIRAFSGTDNLVVKAYEAMKQRYPDRIGGLDVFLEKNIFIATVYNILSRGEKML